MRWPAEALANLGLSIGLGLKYGIVGVALGSLLSTALVHVVLAMPYIAKTFDLSLLGWIASLLRAHLVPAAATAALGWAFLALGVEGLGPVVGAGAAMMVTYLGLLAITGLNRAERAQLLQVAAPPRSYPCLARAFSSSTRRAAAASSATRR